MFYSFFFPYNMFQMRQAKPSYIRILHASPDAPPVDIYANNMILAKNLPYKGFTSYLTVPPGKYKITVFPTGTMNNPVLVEDVNVPPNSIFTVAAVGYVSNLGLLAVPEPIQKIPPNKAMVRFVHLSPNAPNVDIALPNGTKLFEDVEYEEITEYIPVPPGNYTLQALVAETDQVALFVPNINLKPNRFYTVYAVGFVEDNPPLQVLIPLDGNSYIKKITSE